MEEGSIAEKSGLRPGDSILEVNGIPFTNISHEEALKVSDSVRTYLFITINLDNFYLICLYTIFYGEFIA